MLQLSIILLESDVVIPLHIQIFSTCYTALQMKKSMISASAINLVTMVIMDSSYDSQLH